MAKKQVGAERSQKFRGALYQSSYNYQCFVLAEFTSDAVWDAVDFVREFNEGHPFISFILRSAVIGLGLGAVLPRW